MAVTYQLASLQDCDRLMELVREFYHHEQFPLNETATRTAIEQLLQHPDWGYIWLIQLGNEVIGYTVLTLGYSIEYLGRDAFIDEIYLRSAYRGQGIGTQTLSFLEEVGRSLNVNALHLEVEHKNLKAQRVYQKNGYEEHERHLMTKWLSPISKL